MRSIIQHYSISRLNKRHHETFKVLETLKVFYPNRKTLYKSLFFLLVMIAPLSGQSAELAEWGVFSEGSQGLFVKSHNESKVTVLHSHAAQTDFIFDTDIWGVKQKPTRHDPFFKALLPVLGQKYWRSIEIFRLESGDVFVLQNNHLHWWQPKKGFFFDLGDIVDLTQTDKLLKIAQQPDKKRTAYIEQQFRRFLNKIVKEVQLGNISLSKQKKLIKNAFVDCINKGQPSAIVAAQYSKNNYHLVFVGRGAVCIDTNNDETDKLEASDNNKLLVGGIAIGNRNYPDKDFDTLKVLLQARHTYLLELTGETVFVELEQFSGTTHCITNDDVFKHIPPNRCWGYEGITLEMTGQLSGSYTFNVTASSSYQLSIKEKSAAKSEPTMKLRETDDDQWVTEYLAQIDTEQELEIAHLDLVHNEQAFVEFLIWYMLTEQIHSAEVFRPVNEQIFLLIEGHLKVWDNQTLKEIHQIDNTVNEGVFNAFLTDVAKSLKKNIAPEQIVKQYHPVTVDISPLSGALIAQFANNRDQNSYIAYLKGGKNSQVKRVKLENFKLELLTQKPTYLANLLGHLYNKENIDLAELYEVEKQNLEKQNFLVLKPRFRSESQLDAFIESGFESLGTFQKLEDTKVFNAFLQLIVKQPGKWWDKISEALISSEAFFIRREESNGIAAIGVKLDKLDKNDLYTVVARKAEQNVHTLKLDISLNNYDVKNPLSKVAIQHLLNNGYDSATLKWVGKSEWLGRKLLLGKKNHEKWLYIDLVSKNERDIQHIKKMNKAVENTPPFERFLQHFVDNIRLEDDKELIPALCAAFVLNDGKIIGARFDDSKLCDNKAAKTVHTLFAQEENGNIAEFKLDYYQNAQSVSDKKVDEWSNEDYFKVALRYLMVSKPTEVAELHTVDETVFMLTDRKLFVFEKQNLTEIGDNVQKVEGIFDDFLKVVVTERASGKKTFRHFVSFTDSDNDVKAMGARFGDENEQSYTMVVARQNEKQAQSFLLTASEFANISSVPIRKIIADAIPHLPLPHTAQAHLYVVKDNKDMGFLLKKNNLWLYDDNQNTFIKLGEFDADKANKLGKMFENFLSVIAARVSDGKETRYLGKPFIFLLNQSDSATKFLAIGVQFQDEGFHTFITSTGSETQTHTLKGVSNIEKVQQLEKALLRMSEAIHNEGELRFAKNRTFLLSRKNDAPHYQLAFFINEKFLLVGEVKLVEPVFQRFLEGIVDTASDDNITVNNGMFFKGSNNQPIAIVVRHNQDDFFTAYVLLKSIQQPQRICIVLVIKQLQLVLDSEKMDRDFVSYLVRHYFDFVDTLIQEDNCTSQGDFLKIYQTQADDETKAFIFVWANKDKDKLLRVWNPTAKKLRKLIILESEQVNQLFSGTGVEQKAFMKTFSQELEYYLKDENATVWALSQAGYAFYYPTPDNKLHIRFYQGTNQVPMTTLLTRVEKLRKGYKYNVRACKGKNDDDCLKKMVEDTISKSVGDPYYYVGHYPKDITYIFRSP